MAYNGYAYMKHIDWQVKQEPLTSREMRKGIEMMSELLTLMVRFFLHFQLAVDGMKRGEVYYVKKKWGYLKRHTSNKKDKKKETYFFLF